MQAGITFARCVRRCLGELLRRCADCSDGAEPGWTWTWTKMMLSRSLVRSTMSQVRVERAPRGEFSSDRVAVVAQFSQQHLISRSLNTMIAELLGAGYRV